MADPRSVAAAAVALAVLLHACAGSPRAELTLGERHGPPTAAEFPGAHRLLAGVDPVALDTGWRAGDAVLYGLRLCTAAGQRRWLLRVEITAPEVDAPIEWPIKVNGATERFTSRLCRARVTVADEAGAVLGSSQPLLPRDFLQRGFAPACRSVTALLAQRPQLRHRSRFYALVDERLLAEAVVGALALLQIVQDDAVLAPLLWEVVQRPPLLSVLSRLGAHAVVQPRFHLTEPAVPGPGLDGVGAAWTVPMRLLVNDTPALEAELVVADTAPPFGPCGGILGAVARHPTDAGREFAMVLLAARRGPDPRSPASGRETARDRR